MKATIYYKSISDKCSIPMLNTRTINFNSTRGLKQTFRSVITKDIVNLRMFYGAGNIIQASAFMGGKDIACATAKVSL